MSKLSSFRLIGGVPVVVLAFMVAAFLGGCRQAMPTSKDDKDEVEVTITPKEALMGTWQTVHEEHDHNGNVTGTTTFALTFTKTRAILLHTERDSDGQIVEADWCQCESGTWEANETTITKTRVPWLEEAESWGSEKVSVARDYVFVDDAKKVLLVHSWEGHEPTTSFQRYTRVDNPIPGGSITGMWAGQIDWPRPEGEKRLTRWEFTFGESFTEHAVTTKDPGVPYSVENFILSGSATYDTEDYVFSVTVETHTRTFDDVSDPARIRIKPGHVLRYAYAPTGNSGEIAVSLWWAEQDYDPNTHTWVDRETSEGRPIFADGRYQLRLKPVSQ